ncbi:MAG: hypothetical protein AAGF96_06410 [Bacteroidota bacterium]
MKNRVVTILLLALLHACSESEKPKVVYPEEETIKNDVVEKDTALVKIADLPVHIDSTNYLIHPIGEYQIYGDRSSYFSKSRYGSGSFVVSSKSGNELSGNIYNLKFEEITSAKTRMLTDKNIRIKSVRFLFEVFEKTGASYLIYRVLDKDTNGDNTLDGYDISSLYISNIDGTNFTKLTAEFHELIDWTAIPVKNRLYFRSIEDSNRNGDFDQEDKVSYEFIDLSDKEWKVRQYQPF